MKIIIVKMYSITIRFESIIFVVLMKSKHIYILFGKINTYLRYSGLFTYFNTLKTCWAKNSVDCTVDVAAQILYNGEDKKKNPSRYSL